MKFWIKRSRFDQTVWYFNKNIFRNIFFATILLPSTSSNQVHHRYLRTINKFSSRLTPKSTNRLFPLIWFLKFYKKRNIIWTFFHKKHQINKFWFLGCSMCLWCFRWGRSTTFLLVQPHIPNQLIWFFESR